MTVQILDESASGVYIISATPFLDSGEIDFDSIDSLVEFYIGKGVSGITILGMMGEAHRIYLPVASNGFLELLELSFGGSAISGLFGNQDQLLYDWREKLIASPSEEP